MTIAAAVNTTVALTGPFRSGTRIASQRHQGMRVSAHIHHRAARSCRTAARQNTASSASTCGGPQGQPPHQPAPTSGLSSRPSQPTRQASIGSLAASGSGSTTRTASSACHRLGGGVAAAEATRYTWVALMKHIASVTPMSTARAGRDRQLHARAGA